MIDVKIDTQAAAQSLDRMVSSLHNNVLRAVTAQTLALEYYIKASELSGQVLKVRTGNLRASIHSEVQDSGNDIVGRVYSDGSVKYAAIHEYGGTINVPDLYPVRAKALHFFIGGQEIFAKFVRAHKVQIPARPFMAPALQARTPAITEAINAAVAKATIAS